MGPTEEHRVTRRDKTASHDDRITTTTTRKKAVKEYIDRKGESKSGFKTSSKLRPSKPFVQKYSQDKKVSSGHTKFSERPTRVKFDERPSQIKFAERPSQIKFAERPSQIKFAERPSHIKFAERPSKIKFAERPGLIWYGNSPNRPTIYANYWTKRPRWRKTLRKLIGLGLGLYVLSQH